MYTGLSTFDTLHKKPSRIVPGPADFREIPKGEVRRIPIPRTPLNRASSAGIDNGCCEAYIPTSDNRNAYDAESPGGAGGGGPTQDLPGPRGESPAIGGVGLDSFGPNPTANSVGAEEGGSSGARTTIQL